MEETIKFRKLIITNAEREFQTTKGEDTFSVKIPLPIEKSQIITRIARATGGMDVNSFKPEDYDYITMIITLNAVIVAKPDWWDGADKCPDEGLLWELYKFYIDSERQFQENLKKNSNAKKMEG